MILIGDVHGCYKTLRALIKKCPIEQVCFVGDLIDKGPASDKVVEFVRKEGYLSVRGNHEQMLLEFLQEKRLSWPTGEVTLESYGYFESKKSFGKDYALQQLKENSDIQWLVELPLYLEFPRLQNAKGRSLLVSHSSAHKVWRYKDKVLSNEVYKYTFETDIIWERPRVIEDIPRIYNVFGHSPVAAAIVSEYYANLDSGCYLGNRREFGFGVLSALRFPEMEVYTQECID